jgi:hypothetical protein
MMESPRSTAIPNDSKIEIGVPPVSGRLPEKRYAVLLDSSAGYGESTATVDVTPPGLGRWDLLWYASPFAAVAFL